ncbi:MAG: putative ABC transport system substrate-binding protein [Parcubacteria group bacterium Gr01-1014_33]|nr:MAG: putative ABC transport system substrate-binding protein [Parcubacteria group bacterium Gr01-1014_33]
MEKLSAHFYSIVLIVVALAVAAWFALYHGGGILKDQTYIQKKVYTIGILVRGTGTYELAVEGYKNRLRELGYREGDTIVYDARFLSTPEELARASEDFIRNKVDLIHTYSTPATLAAYAAVKNIPAPIPIVFGSVGDPVATGLIQSIAHPGGNVTGVASLSTELTARRLELLKEIDPRIRRVAMPHTAEDAGDIAANKSVVIAHQIAKKLGIELVLFPVRTREENANAAGRIRRQKVDGMIVGGDSLVWASIDQYIHQAIKEKIPFAAFDISQVKKGALVGFGPDYAISGKQAALMTHKIFRGSFPRDIPVEVPEKLLLFVNRSTARAIGIVFPPGFLAEADQVIGE